MNSPFCINNQVLISCEMMANRLPLNQKNHQLLRELAYEELTKTHQRVVDRIGREINVGSPKQMSQLLYKDLGLPEKRNRKTGKSTTDETALLELRSKYPKHRELLNVIIKEKHIRKKIESYIEFHPDQDGFIPYSANPAGTETNRWSFSKSPKSRGLNVQTLPGVMRLFVDSPEGTVFICPDLPQADARIVAWDARAETLIKLFNDSTKNYHLENAIRRWNLQRDEVYNPAWKEEDPRYKRIKVMGHAANYRIGKNKLAIDLGITPREAQQELDIYLNQLYPEIPRWHETIKERIRRYGYLETPYPFNRRRVFYSAWGSFVNTGKLGNEQWNSACAHIPQSSVADIINVGLEKLWEGFPNARIHKHDHDSYLVSVPVDSLGEAIMFALDTLRVELRIHNRPLAMEPEMKYGLNYGVLIPWKGEKTPNYEKLKQKEIATLNPDKIRKELYGYI